MASRGQSGVIREEVVVVEAEKEEQGDGVFEGESMPWMLRVFG